MKLVRDLTFNKLIILSALVLMGFGLTGHFISSYFIKAAKDSLQQNLPNLSGPPPHQHRRERLSHRNQEDKHPHPSRRGERPPRPHRLFRPQVFGMTPEGANSIILLFSLFCGLGCTIFIASTVLKKTARQAQNVFDAINAGDLSARMPLSNSSSENSVANQFNLMANKIEKLIDDIKETEKQKIAIFQELAHDIRTPVAGLNSLLETIDEHSQTMGPEKLTEFTRSCLSEGHYIAKLVEDLLFISGVNKYKMQEDFEEVNLSSIVLEEVSLFHNIDIDFSTERDEALTIANAFLLKRLVRNALENAAGFALSKVNVEIKTKNAYHWSIKISDDGPGLDEKDLQAFGMKSFSRKPTQDGNQKRLSIGLGSYIMKKIAEAHGGTLTIENKSSIEGAHGTGAVLEIILQRK